MYLWKKPIWLWRSPVMEKRQPLQRVFALAVNNLQIIFHLNLSFLEMEKLCCTTQLPSPNTFTNCDSKYSLTFSLINEMRQLSQTAWGGFSTLWSFFCLSSDILQFFLHSFWNVDTRNEHSTQQLCTSAKPGGNTNSLLLLPTILSHTPRESYWSLSCNHKWEVIWI